MVKPSSVTFDRLLGGRVILVQPTSGYRAAIDPVLLAAAVPARPGQRVADLGCGTGAAALCLAARIPGCMVTAIERDPVAAALAQCSTDLNGMNTQVSIFIGDVTAKNILMQSINRFDHVMINPPYLRISTGTMPPDAGRATAYVESGADLATWIDVAWRLLIPCGRLTLIHRADQLDSICALLIAKQFGAVQVIPLWPKAGHPARRVVVRARREAQSPCVLTPGLVLHEENGKFTLAAQAILRNAGPLGF